MFIKLNINYLKDLDPLDPLTEIVKTGQAFSSFIFIERLIWLVIGFFFIGAITIGFKNGIKDQGWFSNKTSFIGVNKKSEKKKTLINKEND